MKLNDIDCTLLAENIKLWGKKLGFQDVRISSCETTEAYQHLQSWLKKGYHAEMHYMKNHLDKRAHPDRLQPGTLRIISVRMDYLPQNDTTKSILKQKDKAFIARYALGRDYHKVIRKKLNILASKINQQVHDHQYRAFTDSAPVLERAIAQQAGMGWIGKNTMLINKKGGSYFFLGELFTNIPLPVDSSTTAHCGSCRACIDICPTQAIVAPYQLDARRCISFLTIENKGSIPVEFRKAMGNRVFGCDDCQLICPWNKFAKFSTESDFTPRYKLDREDLLTLFAWTESEFLRRTEGSAIRRAGYIGWLRNLAVALGNAQSSEAIKHALVKRLDYPSSIVREHVLWALNKDVDRG